MSLPAVAIPSKFALNITTPNPTNQNLQNQQPRTPNQAPRPRRTQPGGPQPNRDCNRFIADEAASSVAVYVDCEAFKFSSNVSNAEIIRFDFSRHCAITLVNAAEPDPCHIAPIPDNRPSRALNSPNNCDFDSATIAAPRARAPSAPA